MPVLRSHDQSQKIVFILLLSLSLLLLFQEIKRARRMFKSMDCDNLRETSQKIIVETFAPVSGMGEAQVEFLGSIRISRNDNVYLFICQVQFVQKISIFSFLLFKLNLNQTKHKPVFFLQRDRRRRRGSRSGERRQRKSRRQPPVSIWHGIMN